MPSSDTWWARASATALRVLSSPWTQWAFVAATVGVAGWALYVERDDISAAMVELDAWYVMLGMACAMLAVIGAGGMWWAMVRDLGTPLSFASSGRIFFIGQLGKYLPGSVWAVVSQAQMGRAVGVSVPRSVSVTTLTFIFGTLSGLMLVLALAPFSGVEDIYDTSDLWWVLVVAFVVLYPPFLTRIVNWILERVGRDPLEKEPTLGGAALTLTSGTLSWIGSGWIVAALMMNFGYVRTASELMFATLAYPLAWLISLLVPLAPAGVGVREGALIMILSVLATPSEAVIVALMTRVLLVVADLLMAGLFMLGARVRPQTFIAPAPGAELVDAG